MNVIETGRSVPQTSELRIGIIQSLWHRDLVDECRQACISRLAERGVQRSSIEVHLVPGAFEIPLRLKMLARPQRFDGLIAIGLIVDGGIYAHEFVGSAVIDGLMSIQLASDTPVFSAVLTPKQFHEHEAHRSFFARHLGMKGVQVADACLDTLSTMGPLVRDQ